MSGADAMTLRVRRVLVLGSDTRAFLSVVRSLGRRGIAVEIAWCPADSPARRSRYISAIHDLPSYELDDSTWLARLVELVDSRRFDLVIPCDDPTTLPLQASRNELERHGSFYLLSPGAFETTMSKRRTHELAQQLGIPIPRQEVVSSAAELQMAAGRLGFPLVMKPDNSFTRDNLVTRQTHLKIRSSSELATAALRVPAIVQEHFTGDGMGVSVLAAEGTILVAFQHRREHEPLMGGGSTYRSSMPVDPRLLEACEKLMAALAYTGVAMVEFKVDPHTQRWILIEVNGRFWGSLPLAIAAGADFPYYLYELLVNGRRDFPTHYRTGVYCRNWSLDFSWTLDNLRANGSDPILMTKPLRRLLRDALRLVTLREHNDTLTRDDPVPGLVETRALARTILVHRREALGARRRALRRR
jgi:predicted ATP-grasp superfamily ATP-dependent carboligase